MTTVASSAIGEIDYDLKTERLYITFRNRRNYAYLDVPRAVYEALLAAPSKGRFFNENIRDRYLFIELAPDA